MNIILDVDHLEVKPLLLNFSLSIMYPFSYILVAFDYGNILAIQFVWDMCTLLGHLNAPSTRAMDSETQLLHCVLNTKTPVKAVRCPIGELPVYLCFCES